MAAEVVRYGCTDRGYHTYSMIFWYKWLQRWHTCWLSYGRWMMVADMVIPMGMTVGFV